MTKSAFVPDGNSTGSAPKPTKASRAADDLHETRTKHNDPARSVHIAPPKPVWPSKK